MTNKIFDNFFKKIKILHVLFFTILILSLLFSSYIFNKNKQLVVDPSSEKLEKEFKNVERSYIPINSVIRVDEVVESGEAKIKENKSQVMPFPMNIQPANKQD